MSLYNSNKSTSKLLNTKMLFVYALFVLVILSVIIYVATKEERETKAELAAMDKLEELEELEKNDKLSKSSNIVYIDEEQLSDLTAKTAYKGLRSSFVVVLGKLSAYERAYPNLSPSIRSRIIDALSKHNGTISIEMNEFQNGINDANSDINPVNDSNGVIKKLGKLELEHALTNITWLMNQHQDQNKTLNQLRWDIKNNPRAALQKLYEISNQED